MATTQLFIPKKCKVGFNLRTGTYTGKLGYVIYHDGKIWRKETSWEGWREKYMPDEEFNSKKLERYIRDAKYLVSNGKSVYNDITRKYERKEFNTLEEAYKELGSIEKFSFYISNRSNDPTIEPIEFENIPTSGFVLNKKAGGGSSGWNHRQTYSRVYDPRGFEFEITIQNLLFILENCNAYKGKGLEGEFIYAWEGKDLILLPCDSFDYKKSKEYTELQTGKIGVKDLVPGYTYENNRQEKFIYLGKFDYRVWEYPKNENGRKNYQNKIPKLEKHFIFMDADKQTTFAPTKSLTTFKAIVSKEEHSNLAGLIDRYFNATPYCSEFDYFELGTHIMKNDVTRYSSGVAVKIIENKLYRYHAEQESRQNGYQSIYTNDFIIELQYIYESPQNQRYSVFKDKRIITAEQLQTEFYKNYFIVYKNGYKEKMDY